MQGTYYYEPIKGKKGGVPHFIKYFVCLFKVSHERVFVLLCLVLLLLLLLYTNCLCRLRMQVTLFSSRLFKFLPD